MTKANDEHNFVKAYEENDVSFQNFDENSEEQGGLENSAFSLIRQIAKAKDEKDNPEPLLGSGDGLKDHESVMSLIKGEKSTPVNFKHDSINIAHVAKPLRNRSSLISFLKEDNDAVGFAARAPIDYLQDPNYQPNRQFSDYSKNNYSYKNNNSYQNNKLNQSRDSSDNYNKSNNPSENKSNGRFSALFKSNHETSSNGEDSLQAIYKRLLKCQ